MGEQVVKRATQSLTEYPAILKALGLEGAATPEDGVVALESITANTPEAAARRKQLHTALALKHYEFNCQGVEMNQRYRSSAILNDPAAGSSDVVPETSVDAELFYIPSTEPGARVPHAWLEQDRKPVSTLDLAGKGHFSLFTGTGGEVWAAAAQAAKDRLGLEVTCSAIGLGCPVEDPYGTWAELREIEESGCLLLRPDAHVAWRAFTAPRTEAEASHAIVETLKQILSLE